MARAREEDGVRGGGKVRARVRDGVAGGIGGMVIQGRVPGGTMRIMPHPRFRGITSRMHQLSSHSIMGRRQPIRWGTRLRRHHMYHRYPARMWPLAPTGHLRMAGASLPWRGGHRRLQPHLPRDRRRLCHRMGPLVGHWQPRAPAQARPRGVVMWEVKGAKGAAGVLGDVGLRLARLINDGARRLGRVTSRAGRSPQAQEGEHR
jgi:hypothetical protein